MKAKPDRTLDCLGLYCPEPVYRTRMELDKMKEWLENAEPEDFGEYKM